MDKKGKYLVENKCCTYWAYDDEQNAELISVTACSSCEQPLSMENAHPEQMMHGALCVHCPSCHSEYDAHGILHNCSKCKHACEQVGHKGKDDDDMILITFRCKKCGNIEEGMC